MGLGTLSSRTGENRRSIGAQARPSRRSMEAPEIAVRRTPSAGDAQGGIPTHRMDKDPSMGAPGHSPAAYQPRTEVRPLEIDWSQIVRRCMDGDSGAWAELVRTHHRRVYGLCYRFTGNAADAEDLTQDVFLKIYSNLASFDTDARQPAGVDHDHDPQPAGGQLPADQESAGDRFAGRRVGSDRGTEAD